jgi:hypothetical protein
MGFGDRERPDDWNRGAYGERGMFGRRNVRDFFNTDYGSTQYGGYNRGVDESRRFNRGRDWDRGDYIGAGYYREDYDREERGESFGDKVKNFFGIGPKGWRRGDDKIRDDVSERLEDHPNIDASNLEVMVAEGEVTLTGVVDNRWAKRLAEDVANDVRGVKDVHNQIRVQQAGSFGDIGRTRELTGTTGTTSQTGGTGQPSTGTMTATTRKGTERAA